MPRPRQAIYCVLLVALATIGASPSGAHVSSQCRLLTAETPLADENALSVDDRIALAALRSETEADNEAMGWSDQAPPTIYNFNSLLVAINPGLPLTQPLGNRTLIVATRINGVTYSVRHAINSIRYFFGVAGSSSIVTRLVFFGETHLEIRLAGPFPAKTTDRVAIYVVPFPGDLEKILCEPGSRPPSGRL